MKQYKPILFPLIIYLLINLTFIFKYSLRQNIINTYALGLLFIASLVTLILLLLKSNYKHTIYNNSFYIISIVFFVFTLFLNQYVNGDSLNIDRWSAMEVAIKALLNGQYPYSAIDHIGGRTSNLPTLIFLGIPFYYLGDVGFLQSFSFLLFAFLIHSKITNLKLRILSLFFLIFSPSYCYEIYVKSDLISNIIITLFYCLFIYNISWNKKKYVIFVAITSASLVLTRLITIIPLTLSLFNNFKNTDIRKKILFITISILTVLIQLAIVLQHYTSYENFIYYNPFDLQNRQLPTLLSLLFITLPFFFSKSTKTLQYFLMSSLIFLGLPIISSFLIKIYQSGIYNCIINSYFDLTYFNILIPFSILYITIYLDRMIKSKDNEVSIL